MPQCTSKTKQGYQCSKTNAPGLTRCKQHETQYMAKQMKLAAMAPTELDVFYNYANTDAEGIDINGQYLTVQDTQDEPCYDFSMPPDTYYTVVMVDPDAPSSKALGKSYLHYLETNIDMGHGDIDTVVPYQGPSPPPNSGDHHYIFYLLEQPGPISVPGNIDRVSFDLDAFIKTYNLKHMADNSFIVAT